MKVIRVLHIIETFDTLLLTVTLDRDFALYFLRDFFPCVMIVVLSWVAFWINYKSTPARVALGMLIPNIIIFGTLSELDCHPGHQISLLYTEVYFHGLFAFYRSTIFAKNLYHRCLTL